MGNRISSKQWAELKGKFPEQVESLQCVKLPMDASAINSFAKNAKSRSLKFNSTNPLASLIDWCSEVLENNFYVRRSVTGRNGSGVVFYFFSEDDATIFKLTWWGNS